MNNKLDSLLLVVLFTTTMTFLREDKRLMNKLNDRLSEAEVAIIQKQKNDREDEKPPVPDKDAGSR